jgi:transmembrane sensor
VSTHGDPNRAIAAEQQAADFVAARACRPSPRLDNEIGEWLVQSPLHAIAYAKAERAWDEAERLKSLSAGETMACDTVAGAAVIAAYNDREDSDASDPLIAPALTRRRIMAGGAAAAAASVVAGWAYWWRPDGTRHLTTAVGEMRNVVLADGSRLHLNTNSHAVVTISPNRRFVRLLRGEAYFDVAHDPTAPFDVEAAGSVVRALGTAFNIKLRDDLAELTVTDGLVGVRTEEGATGKVPAGDAAVIRSHFVGLRTLEPRAVDQRTVWRDHIVEFNGETLEQAVAELNRYRDRPIVIEDQRLAALPVGGRFRVDDIDDFLAALRQTLPIAAAVDSDGGILLMADDRPTPRDTTGPIPTPMTAGPAKAVPTS